MKVPVKDPRNGMYSLSQGLFREESPSADTSKAVGEIRGKSCCIGKIYVCRYVL